jgi:hypothetical protein
LSQKKLNWELKGEPFSLLKSQATKGESFAKFGLIRKKHKDTRRGF